MNPNNTKRFDELKFRIDLWLIFFVAFYGLANVDQSYFLFTV